MDKTRGAEFQTATGIHPFVITEIPPTIDTNKIASFLSQQGFTEHRRLFIPSNGQSKEILFHAICAALNIDENSELGQNYHETINHGAAFYDPNFNSIFCYTGMTHPVEAEALIIHEEIHANSKVSKDYKFFQEALSAYYEAMYRAQFADAAYKGKVVRGLLQEGRPADYNTGFFAPLIDDVPFRYCVATGNMFEPSKEAHAGVLLEKLFAVNPNMRDAVCGFLIRGDVTPEVL
jgi:hypothetical protein